MKRIRFLRDVQFEQTLDYPSIEVDIDREKAGLSDATVQDVRKARHHGDGVDAVSPTSITGSTAVPASTTWSRYRYRQPGWSRRKTSGALPIATVNPLVNLMVRDVATVRRGVRPGEYDRDMSQRYLTLTANVEGEDMGRASRQVARAIAAAGNRPRVSGWSPSASFRR